MRIVGLALYAAVPAAVVVSRRPYCPSHWPHCASVDSCTDPAGVKPSWQVRKFTEECIAVIIFPVQIWRTDDPSGRLRRLPVIPLQEIPHGIPVFSIPLRPPVPGRKASHLIQAACIPGLRNQLRIAQNGIKGQPFQKRRRCSWGSRPHFVPECWPDQTGSRPPGSQLTQ